MLTNSGDRRIGRLAAAALVFLAPLLLAAGPLSKYDNDAPNLVYSTGAGIFDVERCLLDVNGTPVPHKIWQPDRPDRLTLIWLNPVSGAVSARLDVIREGDSTAITGWSIPKKMGEILRECAPSVPG